MSNKNTLQGFQEFARQLQSRLHIGRLEYGDRSFSQSPEKLMDEISEELLDICGWSYILYLRLQNLREAFKSAGGEENVQRSAQ